VGQAILAGETPNILDAVVRRMFSNEVTTSGKREPGRISSRRAWLAGRGTQILWRVLKVDQMGSQILVSAK